MPISTTYRFVWHLFTVFTLIHLYANYQAVLSLKIVTLNNARLILLLRTYLGTETVLSPRVVNREESVILGTGLSGNYSNTLLTEKYALLGTFNGCVNY